MGAEGLVEIKRRLKSIGSTKKITKAMGLVATSKLRKCRKELKVNQEFADIVRRNVEIVTSIADGEIEIPYFNKMVGDDIVYIVITSDSGLCAGYNNNVVTHLQSIVGSNKENAYVITLGNKGISYVKRAGFNALAEYVDISDVPSIKEIEILYKKIQKILSENKVSKVKVVYTEFYSPIKLEVKCEQLLPVENVDSEVGMEYIEPNLEIVLKDTFDMYIKGKLRGYILSSKCSEQSSRMTAMNGATNNANDIITDLNSKYNRIRQAMITQEISEIVGGAEAQK